MIQQEKLDRYHQKIQAQDAAANKVAAEVIEGLSTAGLQFVTYQFACGPVAIAPADLRAFTKDPSAFMAARYGVTPAHYQAWLQHYQMPLCLTATAEGDACGKPLLRTLEPVHFTPGVSDRCAHHNHLLKAIS